MFGRRRRGEPRSPRGSTGASPVAAWYSSTPPVIPEGPGPGLTAGWRPFGYGQHPSDQIGAFNGQMLSRYPAMPKGVMLGQGVESLVSTWYYPTINPGAQHNPLIVNRRQAIQPGAQRRGFQYTGPLGPVNVGQFAPHVVAAQIRQSGLQAQPWARPLVD